jgi:hypothetical protein
VGKKNGKQEKEKVERKGNPIHFPHHSSVLPIVTTVNKSNSGEREKVEREGEKERSEGEIGAIQ